MIGCQLVGLAGGFHVLGVRSKGPITLCKNVTAYADICDILPISFCMLAYVIGTFGISHLLSIHCDTFLYDAKHIVPKKVLRMLKSFGIWQCM